MSGALYLVWHGAPGAALEIGEASHPLTDQMHLVRSDRTRSRLYHAVKHQLPADTALCVAPLAGDPKFKGMDEGALHWLRSGA
jgi:hypothetical protein